MPPLPMPDRQPSPSLYHFWLACAAVVVALTCAHTAHGQTAEQLYQAGRMHDIGEGAEQNHADARNFYARAAELGHVLAQYNLGLFLDLGVGSETDHAGAAAWFLHAAEQGHAGAQHNLAEMYDTGRGVAQDVAAAANWYRRAAVQGDATAQRWLGKAYANGRGVPPDPLWAYAWLLVAAETNPADARIFAAELAEAAQRLSAEQRSQAEDLARRCGQSGFRQCG